MRRNKNNRNKARKGNLKNIFLKGTVATGVMLGGAAMYDQGNVVYAAESESTTDVAQSEAVLDEGASTSTMESQSVAEPSSEAEQVPASEAEETRGADASESGQSISSETGGETSESFELTASESARIAASDSAMQSTTVSAAQSTSESNSDSGSAASASEEAASAIQSVSAAGSEVSSDSLSNKNESASASESDSESASASQSDNDSESGEAQESAAASQSESASAAASTEESASASLSTVAEHEEGSLSLSASLSEQTENSLSASTKISESATQSEKASMEASTAESESMSDSISDSLITSAYTSTSAAKSESLSESLSVGASESASVAESESVSTSLSASTSASASESLAESGEEHRKAIVYQTEGGQANRNYTGSIQNIVGELDLDTGTISWTVNWKSTNPDNLNYQEKGEWVIKGYDWLGRPRWGWETTTTYEGDYFGIYLNVLTGSDAKDPENIAITSKADGQSYSLDNNGLWDNSDTYGARDGQDQTKYKALGANITTTDFTGRYWGKSYSTYNRIDASEGVSITFTTQLTGTKQDWANSVANIGILVQATNAKNINSSREGVHPTVRDKVGNDLGYVTATYTNAYQKMMSAN